MIKTSLALPLGLFTSSLLPHGTIFHLFCSHHKFAPVVEWNTGFVVIQSDSVVEILIGATERWLELVCSCFKLLNNTFVRFLNLASIKKSLVLISWTGWNWQDGISVKVELWIIEFNPWPAKGSTSALFPSYLPLKIDVWTGKIRYLHTASTNYKYKIIWNTTGLFSWINWYEKIIFLNFWRKRRERGIWQLGFAFASDSKDGS